MNGTRLERTTRRPRRSRTVLRIASSLGLALATADHAAAQQFALEVAWPGDMVGVFGDFDGDGSLDVLAHRDGGVDVRLNDGFGSFAAPRSTVTVTLGGRPIPGDLDGDGDLDVVIPELFWSRVLLNNGDATFTLGDSVPPDGTTPRLLNPRHLADVDGDGDLDLIGNGSRFSLWINDGSGHFVDVTATQLPQLTARAGITSGDLEGDGDLDLVLIDVDDRGRVLRNRGGGNFDDEGPIPGVVDVTDVTLADFDGDDDLDLAFATGQIAGATDLLMLQQPDGTFAHASAQLPPRTPGGLSRVRAGDVDDDGDQDLVFATSNLSTGSLDVLINDGSATFANETGARVGSIADPIVDLDLGDVDHDADLEILAHPGFFFSPLAIHLYRNRHRHVGGERAAPTIGTRWSLGISAGPGYATTFHVVAPWIGAVGTPYPLPIPGAWLLEPTTSIALTPVVVPPGIGQRDVFVDVPAEPRLRGLEIAVQGIVLDPLLDGRVTNAWRDTIR